MVNTATQSRLKNFDPSAPPVRAKHFITCSYNDLVHLSHHLRGIKTETYTQKLAHKTFEKSDCCMLTLLEWGHARMELSEDGNEFDDEDHMNHVGEYVFQVNETCLGNDHRTSLIAPTDKDSHDPFLIHITPADMTRQERQTYIPYELKIARQEGRKETQKANKRRWYESQDYGRGYCGQYYGQYS